MARLSLGIAQVADEAGMQITVDYDKFSNSNHHVSWQQNEINLSWRIGKDFSELVLRDE